MKIMKKSLRRVFSGALAVAVMAASVLPVGYGGVNEDIEETYAAVGEDELETVKDSGK